MFDGAAYPYKPSRPFPPDPISHRNERLFYYRTALSMEICQLPAQGVTIGHFQLVKVSVGQADVQRFEPHLGHNWLSCGVFLVKSRHFGLPLAQTTRPNWQSFSAGGSVAIQTWSIYKVYT